jgi:hypothetical protein
VKSLVPSGLDLVDGTHLEADYVVCCTGYARSKCLPPVEVRYGDASSVLDPMNEPLLYRGMLHPDLPCIIFFTGEIVYKQQLLGFSISAEWVTRFCSGALRVPTQPAELRALIKSDEEALNGGVKPDFVYSWNNQHSLSGGHMYFPVEVILRYLKQTMSDLGFSEQLANLFFMIDNRKGCNEICESISRGLGNGVQRGVHAIKPDSHA